MEPSAAATCPRCDAPRVPGPECPACGVPYAKARPRAAAAAQAVALGAALPLGSRGAPPAGASAPTARDGDAEEAHVELLLRAIGPPAALLLAWLVVESSTGHVLLRTFLSMWVHELGHAAAAWLCGHLAFPGPWRTPVSDGRHALVVLAVAAAFTYLAWRGRSERRWLLVAAGVAGLAAELACASLSPSAARAFITFAGDGGALAIGTLLVATVYARPESRLRRGALRWGFLAIGAASFADAFHTWVRARTDPGAAPLGEIEGVALSDASTLTEVHGWSLHRVTGAYVGLGAACLAALAALYVLGVLRARGALLVARGRRGGGP